VCRTRASDDRIRGDLRPRSRFTLLCSGFGGQVNAPASDAGRATKSTSRGYSLARRSRISLSVTNRRDSW